MTIKKISKIGFIRSNPDCSFEEYQKATGGTRQSYYCNRWVASNNKEKRVKKYAAPAKKDLSATKATSSTGNLVEKLENEIVRLNLQIVGFRAVISYLEKQSGLKDTQ